MEYSGKLADPEWRKERARKGGRARHTLDIYIASLVERAPELTDEQKDKLRDLLRGAS